MLTIKAILVLLLGVSKSGLTLANPLPETSDNASLRSDAMSSSVPEYVIIGYRNVRPEQAKIYNDAGTIVYHKNEIGTQIGEGTYTTPGLGDWSGSTWDCIIKANKAKFDTWAKAWIPEYSTPEKKPGDKLWDTKGLEIAKYIKTLNPDWAIAKTFRMSRIKLSNDSVVLLQMVIPVMALNDVGDPNSLGIQAACFSQENITKNPEIVRDWHRVDYRTWQNTRGVVQGYSAPSGKEASAAGSYFGKLLRLYKSQVPLQGLDGWI